MTHRSSLCAYIKLTMRREELDRNPAYQLWLVSNAYQRSVRRVLHPLGITHVQFIILAAVGLMGEDGEIVTQRQIARFGAIDENMTSQVIRSTIEKGWIERSHNPDDARAYRIRLTESGRALVVEAKLLLTPMRNEFFAPIGENQPVLAEMLRMLAVSAETLEG